MSPRGEFQREREYFSNQSIKTHVLNVDPDFIFVAF